MFKENGHRLKPFYEGLQVENVAKLDLEDLIYIYIIAEAERKWIPTIKEVVTNRKSVYLKLDTCTV